MRRLDTAEADGGGNLDSWYDDAREPPDDRPYVVVNMIASADGATAVDGRSQPMSSDIDRRVFRLLRSIPDVILVGAQTVRAEGYGPAKVDEQRQAERVARGQAAQPTIAIVTRSLQLDLTSALFVESRPIVICPSGADTTAVAGVADVIQAGTIDVDVVDALRQLREMGVRLVLCEGGPTLNGNLVVRGLVDEICLTVAPMLAGGELGTGILGRVRLPETAGLELAHLLEEDGNVLCRYKVRHRPPEVAAGPGATLRESADARAAFHEAMGQLDMPMQIVTAATPNGAHGGCLVGFAAQCSIDPPRFMVWLSKKNHTLKVAWSADVLAIHFPGPDQVDLAERFGSRTGDEVDKLASERWHEGPVGVPILDDVPRWFVGRVTERLDSGDHVGFMLEPVAGAVGGERPQLGFQAVKHLEPGHEA